MRYVSEVKSLLTEIARPDAVLRSTLYSHFSESLSGLATIRAYGESERFKSENETRVNVENRFVVSLVLMLC